LKGLLVRNELRTNSDNIEYIQQIFNSSILMILNTCVHKTQINCHLKTKFLLSKASVHFSELITKLPNVLILIKL